MQSKRRRRLLRSKENTEEQKQKMKKESTGMLSLDDKDKLNLCQLGSAM